MISQSLKKKIFKIIPEYSFLIENLKKVYRFFLFLQHFFFLVREKSLVFLFEIRSFILTRKLIKVKMRDSISFKLFPKGEGTMYYWTGLRLERQEVEFIIDQIKSGMTFFDVGSNIGLFSLAVASKYKDIKIYAFESDQETFNILKDNIQLNQLNNIIPVKIALADYNREVSATTIDNFLKANNIPGVDLMKIDIKGAELLLFQGAKNLLFRSDAPIIFYESSSQLTERFGYHPIEIMWLLQDFGYLFFVLDGKTSRIAPRQLRKYEGNIIAIKPEHPCYKNIVNEL